jgi:hypothetical protein
MSMAPAIAPAELSFQEIITELKWRYVHNHIVRIRVDGPPSFNLSIPYFRYHAIIMSNSYRDQEREENIVLMWAIA